MLDALFVSSNWIWRARTRARRPRAI